MSSAENDGPPSIRVINFDVTKTMKDACISHFYLKNNDFVIKFEDGGARSIHFDSKNPSVSTIMKKIHQKLKQEPIYQSLIEALQDMEAELINKSDQIFPSNNTKSTYYNFEDEQKSYYLERVAKFRKERKESNFTFVEWQILVQGKYTSLRAVVEKNFPEAWQLLQFCLAVKSILNIKGCTLPFMGVILAIPSSMKTLVIQLFRKYPYSIYSDSFTPNSFESHNASLSEEQLQKIDLLPKLNNRVFLTPELAPIFTTNEDELRKSLGIMTRILDGHGLETDSGAQGHRRYGNTFFVWIGAAVDLPYHVWKLLGTLGHKIYFVRPIIPEKSVYELEKIVKENNFQDKFNETEVSLLDYLAEIDSAPECSNIVIDENGITKVKWNENKDDEQDVAIACIAQVSNLLKGLRGTVYISKSKGKTRRNNSSEVSDDYANKNNQDSSFFNADESDYDTDYPIIEDASRAVILLRNLALGNAISQGRNFINLDDVPLIIDVALSTTTRARSELIKLLLEHDGELTTSTIVNENKVSAPFAKKTMRELGALGIVDLSAIAVYNNSELKITLTKEYSWFKGDQFKQLLNRHKIVLNYSNDGPTGIENKDNSDTGQSQTTNESADKSNGNHTQSKQSMLDSCGNGRLQSHAETKSTTETQGKNSEACDTLENDTTSINDSFIDIGNNRNKNNSPSEIKLDNNKGCNTSSDNIFDKQLKSEEKNNAPLWGSDSFQHVTVTRSHDQHEDVANHNLTLKEVLNLIKEANGSQIGFNTAVESACSRNQSVRKYLGDKLTSRENKKVRRLAEIMHHKNIEVIKTRPEIILRWIDAIKNEKYPSEII